MNISIVLCTYNRCQSLVMSLTSIAASVLPEEIEWEVLVVDNNSTDATRKTVEDVSRLHPDRFRYLFEPRQGKSNALNTGIREAQGDVLAFVDDDVTVDPQWLANLTAFMGQTEWAGAGGRVVPSWSTSPPRWLPAGSRSALAPLVSFDLGPHPGELKESPFGTNMAFRKTIFAKYDGFRNDLGPRPGSMIRSEDTEFGQRLLDAGERLRYEPGAVVIHPVTPDRACKSYFLAWWLAKGHADVLQHEIQAGRIQFFAIPLVLLRRLVVWTLRWMTTFRPGPRFECKLKVWYNAGMIAECNRGPSRNSEAPKRKMV